MNRLMMAAASLLLAAGTAQASEWDIDTSHTTAGFSIKHLAVSTVHGSFQKVTGKVNLDDKDLTKSTIDVTIDPATIDTRDAKRDAHLKSPDFFDVAKYPTITFKSTKIEKAGKGYKVTGDLTIHGVTKPVTLTDVTITPPQKTPWGSEARGVSATGKINRKDFGLTWNKPLDKAGALLVGDDVTLEIDGELSGKPAGATTAGK